MASSSHLTENLNPQQAEAVTHTGSPLLIIAGAGSGKTRVITHRIAYLALEVGIPLWRILAVTFTNKAAKEMRERVCRIMCTHDDKSLAISTFHSRCVMLLRKEAETAGLDPNFAILDDRDQLSAIKKAMDEVGVDTKKVKARQIQTYINLAKMKLMTPKDAETEIPEEKIPYSALYKAYQKILDQNKSLDFEDLIFRSVLLLRDNPEARERWQSKYDYILVDEFQDTNYSQLELIKLLVGDRAELCVVGDEDQSIYSWRGADVENILDFEKKFENVKLIRLEQNYRSTGNVLKAAESVIENNTMRIGKKLWTDQGDGELLRALVGRDDRDEAEQVAATIANKVMVEGIDAAEIAVFYRSHRLSRALEDAIRKYRVPYKIIGGTRFYDRAEVKDVLSFMRLAIQPHNDLAFERVVNVPTRGIGQKSVQDIMRYAAKHGLSMFEASAEMVQAKALRGKANVSLGEFVEMIKKWNKQSQEFLPSMMLRHIINDSRYKADGIGDVESLDGRAKFENIEELEAVVKEYEDTHSDATMPMFLTDMALDAQREDKNVGQRTISLMTIHNAKGLEYDVVFLVGLEDGIFPNSRTFENPVEFEEERRLFYVALTRARKQLYLSRAARRQMEGFYRDSEPSTYLKELPEDAMSLEDRIKLGVTDALPSWKDAKTSGYDRKETFQRNYGDRQFGSSVNYSNRTKGLSARGRGEKSFQVGDRVIHTILGAGIISELGGRVGNERVYVEFDDGCEQEFVVRFAPLKKIEG